MNWWLWELMKAAGESWQLVPVMNVMLWYFLWVTHKGYGHNHACHVSFAFAGSDTMVSFNVICGFFFTSQRCVLESFLCMNLSQCFCGRWDPCQGVISTDMCDLSKLLCRSIAPELVYFLGLYSAIGTLVTVYGFGKHLMSLKFQVSDTFPWCIL